MAGCVAACLSVGFEMLRVCDVVPLLDVDSVVQALTASRSARLQATGSGALFCPCRAPTQGVMSCTYDE